MMETIPVVVVGGDRFSKAKEFQAQLATLLANLGPLSFSGAQEASTTTQATHNSWSRIPLSHTTEILTGTLSLPHAAFDLHRPLLSH